MIRPQRTAGNQRIFSLYDLEILQKITAYLEEGLNLEAILHKLKDEERQYYRQYPVFPPEPPCDASSPVAIDSLYPVTDTHSLVQLIIQKRKGEHCSQ